ncbi:MAG: hypothetical protein ACE5JR_03445 [Gemmatimonadota bacterium]
MSDAILLVILVVLMGLAFAFGIWAGLGYPGLYNRYEKTGRVPRTAPYKQLIDRFVGRKVGTEGEGRSELGRRGGRPGRLRWARRTRRGR